MGNLIAVNKDGVFYEVGGSGGINIIRYWVNKIKDDLDAGNVNIIKPIALVSTNYWARYFETIAVEGQKLIDLQSIINPIIRCGVMTPNDGSKVKEGYYAVTSGEDFVFNIPQIKPIKRETLDGAYYIKVLGCSVKSNKDFAETRELLDKFLEDIPEDDKEWGVLNRTYVLLPIVQLFPEFNILDTGKYLKIVTSGLDLNIDNFNMFLVNYFANIGMNNN